MGQAFVPINRTHRAQTERHVDGLASRTLARGAIRRESDTH